MSAEEQATQGMVRTHQETNYPVVRATPPIRWFQIHPRYWPNGDEPEPTLQWHNGVEWVDVPKIYGT